MLEEAHAQKCDVAVFPEFSLTGSVDPRRHPERALTLDAEPVRKLVKATWQTGVAVVFGIAERVDRAFHISQVYGHSGRLDGVYRKRHLAEDEAGYRSGDTAGVFQLGAAKFGVTICAEGGVEFPWNDAVAGGAEVVFFCSAPGLYGRRTDEHSWRDGHAWWVSEGLGHAVRHAAGWMCRWQWQPRLDRPKTRTFRGSPRWCCRPARWHGCRTGEQGAW